MKYYSTSAQVVFVDRDLTMYPSRRRAKNTAKAVCFVFDVVDEVLVELVTEYLSGSDSVEMYQWFTPRQLQSLAGLFFWLGGETISPDYDIPDAKYEADPSNRSRSYILSDLNSGRVIVFVALKLRNKKDPLSLDVLSDREA